MDRRLLPGHLLSNLFSMNSTENKFSSLVPRDLNLIIHRIPYKDPLDPFNRLLFVHLAINEKALPYFT